MDKKEAPWWALYALAATVLLIFGGTIIGAYAAGETQLASNLSMGALGAATTALGYFFGSSAGSQKKDDVLSKAVAVPAAPVNAPAVPAVNSPAAPVNQPTASVNQTP